MPTGYTYLIENGEAKTPKDFLKVCLRNFGVMIDYRDEKLSIELPESLPEEHYAENKLAELKIELDDLLSKDDSYWNEKRKNYLVKLQQNIKSADTEYKNLLDKYTKFKEAIENWQCDLKYENIKNFALDQIKISWPNESTFSKKAYEEFNAMSVLEFKQFSIAQIKKDISYYTERFEDEQKRNRERAEFFEGFKKDLEKIV